MVSNLPEHKKRQKRFGEKKEGSNLRNYGGERKILEKKEFFQINFCYFS